MPIQVTCPGCLARFTVSDQFAGREGPCPKCKAKIRIPTAQEQIVIHAPENYGPKDASGKAILKPIQRRDTKLTTPMLVAGITGSLLVPLAAYLIGFSLRAPDGSTSVPVWGLGLGAVLLAPVLVCTLYGFLRNPELEAYVGRGLWIRVAICSIAYAALWGLHLYLKYMLLEEGETPAMMHMLIMLPAMLVPGSLAAMATLDLDGLNAALHCAGYLAITVGLRLIMGLGAF
jgi:hypothetical protein